MQLTQLLRENEEIQAHNRKVLRAGSRDRSESPSHSDGEQSSHGNGRTRHTNEPSHHNTNRPSRTKPKTKETTQGRTTKGDRRPRLPFTDDITEVPLPINFKPLNMDKYNGSTEPAEHLESYISSICLIMDFDAVICKDI